MDFPTFYKKKNFSQPKQASKKHQLNTLQKRQDTQFYPIKDQYQPQTKNQSTGSVKKIPSTALPKYKISTKETIQILSQYKSFFEQQLEQLLKPSSLRKASFQQTIENLLQLPTFRIEQVQTQQELLNRYEQILQGLQYMTSKLNNNQSLKEFIYVHNCQQFVLFFKSLFSKPYFFCNKECNRKIIQVLWENQLFLNKSVKRGLQNLKLWVYGIAIPSNPAAISFHKAVLEHPELITKCLKQMNNTIISCNINKSDSDGNTPLMLAVRNSNNTLGVQKLIKNGCDIFCVPLNVRTDKQKRIKQQNPKNRNQIKIQLNFPLCSRKQQNVLEYLFGMKKNFKVADIFYFSQIYKLKTIKNSTQLVRNIQAIPDCSFQIDWKIGKGFFQSCVKDLIVIFKQGKNLRVDFHVGNVMGQRLKNQHYTFLIKCQQKPSLYLITHHKKKIVDLLQELISQNVKQRYEKYFKMGDSENEQVTSLKSVHDRSKLITQFNLTFSYENVTKVKQVKPLLNSINQYQKQLLNSSLINYQSLEKSQLQAAQNSHKQKKLFSKIPQTKSKIFSSTATLDVDWSIQDLNLSHLSTIINVLGKFYSILSKFEKIISSILTNKELIQQNMHKMLPQKIKLQSNSEFTINAEIKNLIYHSTKLDQNIFNVEVQAQAKNFTRDSQNQNLNSLKSTLMMDEMYSLSISQFLGKTQALIEQQQAQYAEKFTTLLNNLADQDDVQDDEII